MPAQDGAARADRGASPLFLSPTRPRVPPTCPRPAEGTTHSPTITVWPASHQFRAGGGGRPEGLPGLGEGPRLVDDG